MKSLEITVWHKISSCLPRCILSSYKTALVLLLFIRFPIKNILKLHYLLDTKSIHSTKILGIIGPSTYIKQSVHHIICFVERTLKNYSNCEKPKTRNTQWPYKFFICSLKTSSVLDTHPLQFLIFLSLRWTFKNFSNRGKQLYQNPFK